MKVWELREALAGVDPDALVVNEDGEDVYCDGYTIRKDSWNGGSYPALVLDILPREKDGYRKPRATRARKACA
jgi:hypothetical protein